MPGETVNELKRRIEELRQEIEQSREREDYYKHIAQQAGRKRLLEIRELSQLISTYRESQKLLAANSEKLEDLVQARTKELKETNLQLRHTIREQKKTQIRLQRSVELDRVILEISSEFINQPAHKIDKQIIHALEKIGRYSGACRVSLYILTEESESILNTHDWKKQNYDQKSEYFHDHFFQAYLEKLRQKREIVISTADDMPARPKAKDEINWDYFHSLLAIPMVQRGQIYGALFLYGEIGKDLEWANETITFVKIIGDVFVNALERKMSELALRESEERYRDLVEKAGLAIVMDAKDGSFHYFNKQFAALFDYTEKEIASLTMLDLIHPDDVQYVMKHHSDRFDGKKSPTHYEFRGIRKNGEIIYLEVHIVALKMKDQVIATRSYIWDITHRVTSEQAVQESEERYRNLVENFWDIVLISDYSGNVLYTNPAFQKQIGYTSDEINAVKQKVDQNPEHAARLYSWAQKFMKSDRTISTLFENQFLTKNNKLLFHSVIISKITYASKPALQFIAHNITDQKKAENALKRSADFERTVSEIMSQFVGSEITDASHQNALQSIGEWSNAGRATIYRIINSGTHLSSMYEWCDKGIPRQIDKRQNIPLTQLQAWDKIIKEHGLIHVPNTAKLSQELASEQIISGSNDIRSFLFLPFRVRGVIVGAISLEDTKMTGRWQEDDIKLLRLSSEIIGNVFERIETERMLKRSEEQYRTLFDSSNDEIYVHGFTDQNVPSSFINVNKAACDKLGYSKEELLHMTVFDIEAREQHDNVPTHTKNIFQQNYHIFETFHKTKSGQLYPVEVSSHLIEIEGKPVVLSIARDTTERKRIEEEVQKSQRLESIGVLAGGIAHDFNNLLSIILGNAQLAKMMSQQNKDISKFLNNIEEGAGQASTLTRQLLTFSKGGAPIRDIYPLPDLIRNAVQLALSGLDEQAIFDFANDLYNARVDKGQITQVIHNLILNSDQAMPNGGIIEVSAQNVHSDQVKQLRRLNPGYYVCIRIKDFGIGISEEEKNKIFDPYYTTKESGNGLGLTVAYSIIKKHNGLLLLDSVQGEGTTVDIYLPAIIQKQNHTSAPQPRTESYQGLVYVMDDEMLVLDVAEEMLHELGFSVTRAMNGEELLELYKSAIKNEQKPKLVIMDLTIPGGMGGLETIKALRRLDPDVPAIVSSGYSNDKIMSNYQQYSFSGVVAKPYTLEDLQRAIDKALASKINQEA